MAPPAGLEPAAHGLTVQHLDSITTLNNNELQNSKNSNVIASQNLTKNNKNKENYITTNNSTHDQCVSLDSKASAEKNCAINNPSNKPSNSNYPPSSSTSETPSNLDHIQNNTSSMIAEAILAIDRLPIDDSVKVELITKLTGEL